MPDSAKRFLYVKKNTSYFPPIIKGLMGNWWALVDESLTNSLHDYLNNMKPVLSEKVSKINDKFFLVQQVYHSTKKSIKTL